MASNLPFVGKFKVTCEFGRKGDWIAGYHTGIDLVGLDSKEVYSTLNGIVKKIAFDNSYGNYIVILDENGYFHWFCHLDKIYVSTEQKVFRETIIGIMGATGNVTGAHLHYEIRNSSNKYGDVINPVEHLKIPNVVGTYDEINYQIEERFLRYKVHVQDIGWTEWINENEIAGTIGEGKRIEAIIFEGLNGLELKARAHVQSIGWTDWKNVGEIIGTVGQGKRIEALEIHANISLEAQEHLQEVGWMPISIGKKIKLGTEGKALRLEAFRIKVM